MHPLKRAVEYKGSVEFTRSELVGIIAFSLRLMDIKATKELIEKSIESGLLEEREGKLVVNEVLLEEEEASEDLFNEMVEYIAKSLGWGREEVLEGIKAMRERYGDLDEKVLAYLFGMDKGVDMAKFRERLEL
ncbi:DUF2240 family protein [Thermococcus sp. GR7]|uniref:DUF2240 family protein n=1 Tax=unclassified Thermococcus TaxID=2627626 RepID=UPI0014311435|nr:DUF2240 family protein [Thermococcus sp. GR7]NJE78000.1 DUF2240 family protein [Thermococcus sp. GR4]NJF22883.1 DUF2240 family protein [Thermococcus sp. GR5]